MIVQVVESCSIAHFVVAIFQKWISEMSINGFVHFINIQASVNFFVIGVIASLGQG